MRPLAVLFFAPLAIFGAAPSLTTVPTRPMIWVTPADRAPIVQKIATQPWAQTVFAAMKARVAESVAAHALDPEAFLRGLPFVASAGGPKHPTFALIGGNMAGEAESRRSHSLQRYLQVGTDCAVLYYLTGEESYASCAADILHASAEALVQMPRNNSTESGGIVYPGDVLYEARAVGAQLPVIYDFLQPWLARNATVYSVVVHGPVAFSPVNSQRVFRNYARLIIEHGQIDSNHPVLEMPCLALNALAVDNPAERADLLSYLTTKDTPHQDSLKKVMAIFAEAGGIWPESFQYSVGVSARVTYLAALLRRQSPPAIPLASFAAFPLSLVRLTEFRFPNGENLGIGDSPRRTGQPYEACEIAYALAIREGDLSLQRTLGGIINLGIAQGRYDRAKPQGYVKGADSYQGPLQLLWFAPEIVGQMAATTPRTTDELPFAGVVLQRNLSPDGQPAHALMAVVAGGSHVHSHASGMALELFGVGEVLGARAGKGTYTTDDHENHRRLFAANNSVIVNGASRSSGSWVNLGTDTVHTLALEPAVGAAPVSPQHSFSLSAFTDTLDAGEKAQQERLVGIVRTSASTGYYVDVFRSRARQAEQFHDYLYHNLGDTLDLATSTGPLALADTPDRFVPAPGTTWSRNRTYLYPGWHVFKSVQASPPFTGSVTARFEAKKLSPSPVAMRVFIPGGEDRDYARALAPSTHDAPEAYTKAPTPVLVIRQHGEAWTRPFAVIYEPTAASAGTIQSVTALTQHGEFAGFKIVQKIAGRTRTDHVVVLPTATSTYDDPLGLSFTGRYAVVTLDDQARCTTLYLGEGASLACNGAVLRSVSGTVTGAYATLDDAKSTVTTPKSGVAELTLADGRRFPSRAPVTSEATKTSP